MRKLFLLCCLLIPYFSNAQCDGVDLSYQVIGDSVLTHVLQPDSSISGSALWYHNNKYLGTSSSMHFAITQGNVKIELYFDNNNGDTCYVTKSFYHKGDQPDSLVNCGLQPFVYSIDGHTVSFDYNNSQADTLSNSVHWFFGDGSGGSGFYATHTYSTPGVYEATLLFMGHDSCTVSEYITIAPIVEDSSFVSDTLGYSVAGYVVSSLPKSLLGTEISLYTYGNGTVNFFEKTFLTDTTLFSFENLPSGSYLVQITPASNSELFYLVEPTFYNGTTNWQDAQVVNLNQNIFLEINFMQSSQVQIPDAYWFSGNDTIIGTILEELPGTRVLTANGFEHALVALYNKNGEKLAAMFTNTDGRYQFTGLPAGEYTLRVSYPGNAEDKEIVIEIDGDGNTQEFVADFSLSKDAYVLGSKKKGNYNLALYPNPAKETIRLAGMDGNVKLEVLDLNGRLVDVLIGNAADGFSIANLKSGLYMIRIIHNNEVNIKSLVKE